ncbi:Carboxypeptidase B-like protein, partial [Leptotrombidium deliense]
SKLSDVALSALSKYYGTEYRAGNIATTIYSVSSSASDWVYANTPCKLVFALELRDTGDHGFLLPPSQIKPTAIETWAGVSALVANA